MSIGDLVWNRRHDLCDASQGFSAKLAPKFDEPFEITGREGANIFLLKNAVGKETRAHVKDLKPHKY